jgi:radical SAM superfamily enzyme YgiQ (UPF0313 family)
MRVLLIGPSKRTSGVANWGAPPLGVHRLAAWLRSRVEGVDVEVCDPCLTGPPSGALFEGRDLIGFSPLNETLPSDLALMHRAHNLNPTAILVAGGVEATLNYQTILDKSPVEWIVLGDGERPLEAIVRGESDIPGTVRRIHNQSLNGSHPWDYYCAMDFGAMNYPTYWEQTAGLYKKPPWEDIRTVRLVTSTHCNRGCAFCSVTQWHKASVGRVVPPAILSADQLLSLCARVKREVPETRTVYFCEDDFCQSRQRVEEFCLHSHELGLSYLVQTHSSRVDGALVETLAAGGVRHLTLGIENASEHVLESFHKRQDLGRVPDIIHWCNDAGIVPYLLIILFAPASTVADLWENVTTLSEWMEMGARISIEPYTMPYRGAPLYDSLHEFGWNRMAVDGTKEVVKHPTVILPDDPQARAVMFEFERRWGGYKADHAAAHSYKGTTGALMLALLREILESPPEPMAASAGQQWDYISADRR